MRYAELLLLRRRAVRWLPILGIVLSVAGCGDRPATPHYTCNDRWVVKSDSLNFAVLIVNAETYAFEGGTLSYYAPCDHCADDSLPMGIHETYEGDFGSILFSYPQTGDTLFAALLGWMTPYYVEYPHAFSPPDSFEICEPLTQPRSVERIGLSGMDLSTAVMVAAADSVWSVISPLDLTHALAGKMRVGYFLYPYWTNDGGEAKWVVFLCRADR
jgi:hypothetical protein